MRTPADVVHAFIGAVESADLQAVCECFTEDATYANVGYPPARGHAEIRAMLAPIISRSSHIEWQVHAEATAGDLFFAERTDRFRIDGCDYAVQCNGVFRVDAGSGLIAEVRDYVDLGIWRARLGSVLSQTSGAAQG